MESATKVIEVERLVILAQRLSQELARDAHHDPRYTRLSLSLGLSRELTTDVVESLADPVCHGERRHH